MAYSWSTDNTQFNDDFQSYADYNTLDYYPDWVNHTGQIDVVNNSASGVGVHGAAYGRNACYVFRDDAEGWAGDQYSEISTQFLGSNGIGPAVRCYSGVTFYYVKATVSDITLYRVVDGTATELGTVDSYLKSAGGDSIKLVAEDESLKVYVNSSLVISEVDNSISVGSPGIYCENDVTGSVIQDVEVGDFVSTSIEENISLIRESQTIDSVVGNGSTAEVSLYAVFPNNNLQGDQSIVISGTDHFNGTHVITSVESQDLFVISHNYNGTDEPTNATAGGDYSDLSEFTSGVNKNLVAQKEQVVAEIYNDFVDGLTHTGQLGFTEADWTTSRDYRIILRTASRNERGDSTQRVMV